jgi:ATP-dependent RNA helicase DeaD
MHRHENLPQAFAQLGVETPVLMAVRKMGFETPTDIQRELIPRILAGHDILGQARTGTGKTAAFGIPVLQGLDKGGRLQALCLVPTRELAVQVATEVQHLAEFTGLHCVSIYGGERICQQVHKLGRKPHFVIGTPGRVLDLLGRRMLDLSHVRVAILDEVDRMLDIGFRDDIRDILSRITGPHQSIFVSATIVDEIRSLAMKHSHDLVEVNVSGDHLTVDEVEQHYATTEPHDKFRLLRHILEHDNPESMIVFTNTKAAAHRLTRKLFGVGVEALEIHGDLIQRKRDRVMEKFRGKRLRVLVATDLASRGLDVRHVTHIINFDVPNDAEIYVHRIGRTARMGAEGRALTFVTRAEGKQLTEIERLINRQIPERVFPGYAPTEAPPPRPVSQDVPALSSRLMNVPAEAVGVPTIRRTLGGRFKPSRRRR